MPEEIQKFLKVKHKCKSCRKPFTNRVIVGTINNFSIADLTAAFYKSPANLKECPSCKATNLQASYSFYHEEKLKI